MCNGGRNDQCLFGWFWWVLIFLGFFFLQLLHGFVGFVSLGLLLLQIIETLGFRHGFHDGLDPETDIIELLVHGIASEHTQEDEFQRGPALVKRQENNNCRADGTPDDGNGGPESEVALAEDFSRQSEDGPDDDDDESKPDAPLDDPITRVVQLLLAVFRFRYIAAVEFHQGDVLGGLPVVVLWRDETHDSVDCSTGQDRHQVARQHGSISSRGIQIHSPVLHFGDSEPDDDTRDAADDGAGDGARGVRLGPQQKESHRYDGGADEDAHGQVHPAQRHARLVQQDR